VALQHRIVLFCTKTLPYTAHERFVFRLYLEPELTVGYVQE